MKILHVLTLMSPLGEYGGPARVALNQLKELQSRGHDVTLTAGHRGYDRIPKSEDAVPLQLFGACTVHKRLGFAGLAAPGLLAWIARHHRDFDVVHVHLARDLVTLPAARLALALGLPVIAQTHGMIIQTNNVAARPLDFLLTRPTLRGSKEVLCLTTNEELSIKSVSRSRAKTSRINNGIKSPSVTHRSPNVVPEVLFLARLQSRKRPTAFVELANILNERGYRAKFRIVGPDEGEAGRVEKMIATSSADIEWEGPIPPDMTASRMERCDVYVLPSINEPYPMSVIEAMSLGKPVIITDSCGLADLITKTESGIVTNESVNAIASAVIDLLSDHKKRVRLGRHARKAAAEQLSISDTVANLEQIYQRSVRNYD